MNCKHKPEGDLNDQLGRRIAAALQAEAEQAAPSADLDKAVWQGLARRERARFGWLPRHFGKRLALTLCALFCLSCCAVVAEISGTGGGWVSRSGWEDHFTDFARTADFAAQLDYTPLYVQELAGGYTFHEGHISQMQRLDENGHRMSHVYKSLFMDYRNPQSGELITLVVDNAPQFDDKPPLQSQSRMVGEVELVWGIQPYKFVPVDYVLTGEDKAALANGSLEISVGSDKVERTVNMSVCWTQNGLHYNLFGWDLELDADDMLDIAADFVEQTTEY